MQDCHAALRELEAFQLLKPRWMPHSAFVRLAERRATKLWRSAVASAAPEMAERVQGIADGAGVRAGSLHLLNILEPLMADLNDVTVIPPLGGCSALAVSGERSATGEPMLVRNFDYLPLIQPFYTMRDTRPANGMRSLDFTCVPLGGAIDGINEAGLCITCNYAYVRDEPAHAGTITMAIGDALARCRSVREAAEFLAGRSRWGGGMLMLADESGDVASLELSNSRSELRRPTASDHGVVFHTNRFQTPTMREIEVLPQATFTKRAPTPLRGRVVHDSADARHARLTELTSHAKPLTIDTVSTVMADHGDQGEPSSNSLCMHSDYWNTTATLQLFPRTRTMRVAFDSACRARFTDLRL